MCTFQYGKAKPAHYTSGGKKKHNNDHKSMSSLWACGGAKACTVPTEMLETGMNTVSLETI